jgi:3-oxoadipate enol-lactonase
MPGPAQSTSGFIDAQGGPLYYEVAGQGHPFLLIHAGVADHSMWDDQWELFAQRYRVIRYDTRGYGKTPVGDRDYSNRQDIYDLFKHLGVDKAYVLGVSRGGQIATDFTLEHPELVDALIPVNAGLSGFEGKADEALTQTFNQMEEAYEQGDYARLIEMELQMWVAGPNRSLEQMDPALVERARKVNPLNDPLPEGPGKPVVLEPPAAGRLAEISVPTLVIVGDQDLPGVLEAADALAAGIPGARKVVIRDAAHMVSMEKPEEFNRVVLDFLGALR